MGYDARVNVTKFAVFVTRGYNPRMKVYSYERKDSPFIWLKWEHPVTHRAVYKSSGIRKGDKDQALRLAKKINAIQGHLLSGTPQSDGEAFADWVKPYFERKHSNNRGTLHKNRNSWNWLAGYLRHIGVTIPRELTRAQVLEYIDWRCERKKQKSDRLPSRNTALYDLRILGKILQEAVDRGFCERNVARRLGIAREDVKEKLEISEEEEATIRAALESRPDWMRVSFAIAIDTSLRFQETRLDLRRDIDFISKTIKIEDPKGGRKKAFSRPLPSSLVPLLKGLRDAGKTHTWDAPVGKGTKPLSMQWRDFFDSIGMRHLSFHCTRVTWITREVRKGTPERIVMKLANHANKEVSRIYQKLNLDDVRQYVA